MSEESLSNNPDDDDDDKTLTIDELSTKINDESINIQTGSFLKNRHPELFEISPRAGGFLRNLPSRQNYLLNTVDQTILQRKGNNLQSSTGNENILHTEAQSPESREKLTNDMLKLCSAAISTVMMLAQHSYESITSEHVKYTEEYFRGLKQADEYPPNVGQLMETLNNLKKTGKILSPSKENEEDQNEEEEEKQIT